MGPSAAATKSASLASDHGYRGLVAEAYDLHPPPYDDEEFYRTRIEEAGGPALEIGSGTGRLVIPYVKAGLDVEGVEPSEEMAAICESKAQAAGVEVTVHRQYAQSLSLKRRFRTIYIPVSSFQLIEDLGEATGALTCFRDHLEPGGQLLVSLFIPDEQPDNEWPLGRRLRREDGSVILISHASRSHADRQLVRTTSKYELFRPDGLLDRTEVHFSSLRWYERAQFQQMLTDAGFSEVISTDDLTDVPVPDPQKLMMFRAVC